MKDLLCKFISKGTSAPAPAARVRLLFYTKLKSAVELIFLRLQLPAFKRRSLAICSECFLTHYSDGC